MNIFNDIARQINKNTKSTSNYSNNSVIELGKITSSGLKLNNFKHEIKNYKILNYMREIETLSLKSGDVVLVATFENDCVVLGKVI